LKSRLHGPRLRLSSKAEAGASIERERFSKPAVRRFIVEPVRDTANLKRDLADFTPDEFEQFVTALVRVKHPDRKVERLAAPDGGADVLVWKSATEIEVVYQVKHYPRDIGWDKCEESLTRATQSWRPDRIVFAFPRDLSKPLVKSFRTRLRIWSASRSTATRLATWPPTSIGTPNYSSATSSIV
jgi:hypothetical protein